MERLLRKKDVASRWQVSERTIDNYIKNGILQPVKTLSIVRFTEEHIRELEGVKLDRMSPLERRRLESDIEKLKLENEKLKGIIKNILTEASSIISLNY